MSKMGSSYDVKIVRTADNVVMYRHWISATLESRSKRKKLFERWNKLFNNKLSSGEWFLSITCGFEQFN